MLAKILKINDMAKSGLSKTVSIYVNGKQVDSTLKSLQAELAKLRNHQRLCEIGSEDYIQTSLKMREIKTVIDEQRKALEGLEERTKSIGGTAKETLDKINKGLRNLGLQDLGTPDNWIKSAASMSDAYAAVQKTTGMTAGEVERLNERLKKIDTRTGRKELNELAAEAGKLGLTGVDAVAGFVESANEINVALGDDLGKGAMVTVGKLATIYEETTGQLKRNTGDIGAQMQSIGSALNSLGAASSASAEHMVDFLNRMGGVSQAAGLSAGDVLGFASVLDQANISMESSATAMSKLIMQIFKKPEEFASAAGMAVKDFTELALTDMNGALLALFQNMQGSAMDDMVQRLVDMGMTGSGATQMLSTLAAQTEAVAEAQALANEQLQEATSIGEEYATVNETSAARMEKLQNKLEDLSVELGETLMPYIEAAAGVIGETASILSKIIDYLQKNVVVMSTLTGAVIGYLAVKYKEKALMLWEKAQRLVHIGVITAQTVATGGLTAATHALNAALRANPFGAVFAAIGLVVGIVTTLIKKFKQLRKESKEGAEDQAGDAEKQQKAMQAELEEKQRMSEQERLTEEERKKRAAAAKKRHEEYMKRLEEQAKVLKKNDELIKELNARELTGLAKSIEAIDKKIAKQEEAMLKAYAVSDPSQLEGEAAQSYAKLLGAGDMAKHREFQKVIDESRRKLSELREANREGSGNEYLDQIDKAVRNFEKSMRSMDQQVEQWEQDAEAMAKVDEEAAEKLRKRVAQYRELRKEMKQTAEQRAIEAMTQVDSSVDISGYISGKEESGMARSRKEYLSDMRAIEQEYDALMGKIAAARNAERDMAEALEVRLEAEKDPDLAKQLQTELNMRKANIATLEEQAEKIEAVKKEKEELADNRRLMAAAKEAAEAFQSVTEKMMDAFSSIGTILDNIGERELKEATKRHDEEVELLDERLEKGIISQETYNERKQGLDEELTKKSQEMEVEQFERQKLMNIAQAAINGALAIMNVWATTPTPAAPAMSAVVAALTALQIAAIASEPVPYARGGYVNRRTVYQAGERGREWVASNELLRNPETAGVIEWLEAVQRRRVKPSESVPMARANMPAATAAARQIAERQRPMRQAAAVADASRGELLDEFRMLRQYMEDPRNRQAVISRQTQLRFDEQENFLRQRARI